ncbi:hypothetical protein [Paenibacillus sp. GCM10027626]|uniref:hypothetical protein n=1 Tax=Paenibacillus sp. GCM10027626 TaxID=3273411 RepID=UPI0036364354
MQLVIEHEDGESLHFKNVKLAAKHCEREFGYSGPAWNRVKRGGLLELHSFLIEDDIWAYLE